MLKNIYSTIKNSGSSFLSVFTEIYPNEVKLTLSLFATVFLILTSYYMAKPVRESWLAVSIIGDLSKIEVKAYSGFLQSVVLIGLIPLYSHFFDRLPRGILLVNINLFFILFFPLFWLLQPGLMAEQIPFSGVIFYIWIGIFAVTIVAQFWAFAADLYNEDSGKRLFPLIALGASTGAIAGSICANFLIKNISLVSYDMLLVAPLPLLLATVLLYYIDHHHNNGQKMNAVKRQISLATDSGSAFRIILGNRYLLLIALFIFLLNWVSTNGENILFAAIQESIAQSQDFSSLSTAEKNHIMQNSTAEFYSTMYFWVNLFGVLLQAFVVSRLLLYGGLSSVLLIPPFISLAGYGFMTSIGGLNVLTIAKTTENAANYSITNTARHILWLPVARDVLYKAKTLIDTMCVRFADGLAAVTVIMGTRILDFTLKDFFILNIIIIVAWVIVAILILRERKSWSKDRS